MYILLQSYKFYSKNTFTFKRNINKIIIFNMIFNIVSTCFMEFARGNQNKKNIKNSHIILCFARLFVILSFKWLAKPRCLNVLRQ